jgi:hypothetical protein
MCTKNPFPAVNFLRDGRWMKGRWMLNVIIMMKHRHSINKKNEKQMNNHLFITLKIPISHLPSSITYHPTYKLSSG